MTDDFFYDVFLSHSSKDKDVVRAAAERLRKDGIKVWFDEWVLKPGDSIPSKIEEGLEHSRVLVLCMSANAFGSDWAQLEAGTFRFRDPLNKERRFIPLRLDETPIKGSLTQILYINWKAEVRDQEYAKLLEACRPPTADLETIGRPAGPRSIRLGYRARISAYAFASNWKHAVTSSYDRTIRLWDLDTGLCLRVLNGHSYSVASLALSDDQQHLLSGAHDQTLRVWDIETGRCLHVFQGHPAYEGGHNNAVYTVAWSRDHHRAVSGAHDETLRLWNVEEGDCLRVLEGHSGAVRCAAWSGDGSRILSGSEDHTVRMWETATGRCLRVFEDHTGAVRDVVWSADDRFAFSGSSDGTLRLWELETGRCLRVLEGHVGEVRTVVWSANQQYVLSGSTDRTVRLWEARTGRRLGVMENHSSIVVSVAWSPDSCRAISGDVGGAIQIWDLSTFINAGKAREDRNSPETQAAPDQVQYTNAKVLLVGESGAGKTGLSKRLALDSWEPSDSTIGAWAMQWKLPVASSDGVEKEIWLWDFGGQADQRLVHQLYMDDTALAVLVFDGQKEDLFDTLSQWDRDLARASRKPFAKLLVAGRVDAGGLRMSRTEIEKFAHQCKFQGFLETSAKQNLGCEELKQAILSGIDWNQIPCRTTEILFRRLKEEIIRLKDEGRVLVRFNELRDMLQLNLSREFKRFADEELRAVVTLLAGPGVVWELKFGSWVLLQPERINAYAQAVIQTLRTDEHQRGCLMEERVLRGDLAYASSMARLDGEEERFVLLAMHQTLVERGLCLRQPTDKGNLLVFPSYYRRERPEQVKFPAVLVSYHFTGFLDEIYATLVVRLHHTEAFEQDHLWRYAADFKTKLGKQLGVKLTRRAPGEGVLEVYFEPTIAVEERIIFSKYVHEHLLRRAHDVERLRHYVCPHCNTAVGNRDVAMKRLNAWLQSRPAQPDTTGWFSLRKSKEESPSIICSECEQRVPLWDDLEQCFANPEIQQRVRDMQAESAIVLDNESKERALVGEVISTVALAAQISRELNVSDNGIDMEIEFKDDRPEATGKKLYLQLKSGDSYLRERKSDGAEIFTIKDERHARYWTEQAFPVLLVIRNSEGEVRWMRIDDYLKRERGKGNKPPKAIIFEGERFDVMSVRRWRERVLGGIAT